MSLDGSQPQPQYTTAQDGLLTEVFQGHFENFRTYLKERDIVELALPESIPLNFDLDLGLLSQALQGTNVTTVDLSNNGIRDDGAINFAKYLQGTNVTAVNLSGNHIGDAGAPGFAQNLLGTNITTVDLSNNGICDDGAINFAKCLQGTNVTAINLASNIISSKGAIRFVQNLQGTNVTTIDLSNTEIRDAGALTVAKLLKTTKVTTARFDGNNININQGALALKRALEIQNYFRPYAVMRFACGTANKQELTLTQSLPKSQEEALAYAFGIVQKLPNEIAAMVAQRLIDNNIDSCNPLTDARRFNLAPTKSSPFFHLAHFLSQGRNKRRRAQEEEPAAKQRKLTAPLLTN